MGKVSTPEVMMKKKKGRPSKISLSHSTPPNHRDSDSPAITYTRSAHRNPSIFNSPPPEFADGVDDDKRKEKKPKLIVRLPRSEDCNRIGDYTKDNDNNNRHSQDSDSASGSDSGPENEDQAARAKKPCINSGDRRSDGAAAIQEKNVGKAIVTLPLHGSGPAALLPDKKLLVFILDRLQKKDTYGVFSEPVDINELPDYFEIIKQPMDFGTVRKKLDGGSYKSLDELEADVSLICSNAMKYNAADTVYYRQARTIQDIAKRDFENLRHEGANGEPQPKVVRRGRPPGNKNQKKLLETSSPLDRVVPEPPSNAAGGSNSYNLRKAPPVNRFRSSDMFVPSHRSRNGENYSEWLADWNDEFPAKILRADMKYGKKQFNVDVNRRETYRQFSPVSNDSSSVSIGDTKVLVPVGLNEPLAYARSVARFAANLGPVAWKVATSKIDSALPSGVRYGPGWVGQENENESLPLPPLSFSTEKQRSSNSSSAADDFCNSNMKTSFASPSNSQSQLLGLLQGGDAPYMKTPFPAIVQQKQQQQHLIYQPQRNGIIGTVGRDEATTNENWNLGSIGEGEVWPYENSLWGAQEVRYGNSHNATVGSSDLNVRVPMGSPSSSCLQIGSPQHPDLALQL